MDRLTRTVREQVALGRLLPLGGPDDAVWITERAVVRALRRACAALPGVRLGDVGVGLGEGDDEDGVLGAVSPAAPVGALPHLPVRVGADFEATADEPLPLVADRLRDTLGSAAKGLGLVVEGVDLHVTGLLEADAPPASAAEDELADGEPDLGPAIVQGTAEGVGAAARAVPGVLRLTRRLAGLGGGVRIRDTEPPEEPARLVQLQIATGVGHVPLAVGREAVSAAGRAARAGAPGPVLTTVVVTDVP